MYRAPYQIYKTATDKTILDISDLMNFSQPKKNRIVFTLVDYQPDHKIEGKSPYVCHYTDPGSAKTLCWQIMTGKLIDNFQEFKGSNGQARVLTISVDRKSRPKYPYSIKIDVGEGKELESGIVQMVKRERGISINLSEFDMIRLAITLLDYIRAKEFAYFTDPILRNYIDISERPQEPKPDVDMALNGLLTTALILLVRYGSKADPKDLIIQEAERIGILAEGFKASPLRAQARRVDSLKELSEEDKELLRERFEDLKGNPEEAREVIEQVNGISRNKLIESIYQGGKIRDLNKDIIDKITLDKTGKPLTDWNEPTLSSFLKALNLGTFDEFKPQEEKEEG